MASPQGHEARSHAPQTPEFVLPPSLLRWAGHVSRMLLHRLPRQLPVGFVAKPRPTRSQLMTWGRTLKKALVKCCQSPSFPVWRQAASDRLFWRQMAKGDVPPPKKAAFM